LVLGYRAGIEVFPLHTTRFHPTGAIYPEPAEGLLITEKFKGTGTNLVNIDGNQFIRERETRDACAASIIRECIEVAKGVKTPNREGGSLARYADD
jgi:aspartate oxidase